MCEEDEAGLIESILGGLFIFFGVMLFFKVIAMAFAIAFELLKLAFNCCLYILSLVSNKFDMAKVRASSMGSFDQRQEMAAGLSILLIAALIIGAIFATQGNSSVQASPKYQTRSSYMNERRVEVTALRLNARLEPNSQSKILFQLNKGTQLPVKMTQGRWTLIEKSGKRAWVHSAYLKTLK
ncbi:SH3 domain-containing protein [Vibrio ishigakensis]|uniref:SH3 domain-containing protein n=1 Tax=Vibrio ishigakensis TaxID=1481914 RepID=UPI0021C2B260|nr:SH3 domain-containing protein [Vibrio ishigakensis]